MINKILLPLAFFLALGSGQKSVADSSNAYLANTEASFLGRVLQHDTVSAMESSINDDGYSSLTKVEKKQVYRCPGCFLYELTYAKYSEGGVQSKTVRLRTSLQFSDLSLNVTIVDD